MPGIKRILASVLTVAGLTVTWLYAVPPSTSYAQSQPGVSGDQTRDVTDQKLDAAVAAIKQVASVREDYTQRIESAAPADRERIANEGKDALAKAITDQGLTLPEYTAILVIAQNDPEIEERMLQRLRASGQ